MIHLLQQMTRLLKSTSGVQHESQWVPLMKGSITIGVDCHGQWIKKSNQYVWRWKESEMLETITMKVQSDVSYDDFLNLITSYYGLNCQLEELFISYTHNSFENQRVLPFKITDQVG
ncbi:hypothetical protein P3L10_010685 [Capsicum annuum]